MTERTTQVDGLEVRYIEEGEGKPLILLHGASLGSSGDVFQRNFGPLARGGFRSIAPDRPGYGGSDGPGDRTPAGQRRFVLGLMDALGLESAVVVGHSQQGGTAAILALDEPRRVPRAVILGGGGVLPPASDGTAGEPEGERLEGEPTPEWTRKQLEANLYNHALITPEAIAQRHRMSLGRAFSFYSQRSAGGGGRPAAAAPSEPLWRRVGENPERFLLLFGRQDKPTTVEQCEHLMAEYPRLRLLLLDGCRHLVMWDKAEVFERETIAFVGAGAVTA